MKCKYTYEESLMKHMLTHIRGCACSSGLYITILKLPYLLFLSVLGLLLALVTDAFMVIGILER